MANARRRPLILAAAGLATVWLLAGAGYFISSRVKVTADKVAGYLQSVDPGQLSGRDRAEALRELTRLMTALPPEERRRVRQEGAWERWFAAMTDAEKGEFIESTMPSGFRQMLASFEKLTEDKRRRAVNDALREMRKTREAIAGEDPEETRLRLGTNGPPLSEELQQKVVQIGLQTFYSESSAQTKAELAPVLEEMQRLMESGALFRGPRRP